MPTKKPESNRKEVVAFRSRYSDGERKFYLNKFQERCEYFLEVLKPLREVRRLLAEKRFTECNKLIRNTKDNRTRDLMAIENLAEDLFADVESALSPLQRIIKSNKIKNCRKQLAEAVKKLDVSKMGQDGDDTDWGPELSKINDLFVKLLECVKYGNYYDFYWICDRAEDTVAEIGEYQEEEFLALVGPVKKQLFDMLQDLRNFVIGHNPAVVVLWEKIRHNLGIEAALESGSDYLEDIEEAIEDMREDNNAIMTASLGLLEDRNAIMAKSVNLQRDRNEILSESIDLQRDRNEIMTESVNLQRDSVAISAANTAIGIMNSSQFDEIRRELHGIKVIQGISTGVEIYEAWQNRKARKLLKEK